MALKDKVTATEYKIMGQLSRGFSEKEIAAQNFVSPKTVNVHTYNIRKKLKARGVSDVVRIFILSLEDPKKYFVVIAFLFLQGFIITSSLDVDLRRAKTNTRLVRGARKKVTA